jgi:hypothetical protein
MSVVPGWRLLVRARKVEVWIYPLNLVEDKKFHPAPSELFKISVWLLGETDQIALLLVADRIGAAWRSHGAQEAQILTNQFTSRDGAGCAVTLSQPCLITTVLSVEKP